MVKIIALTRGVHAHRPYGQLVSCPILLSCRIALILNKIEHFSKVSNYGRRVYNNKEYTGIYEKVNMSLYDNQNKRVCIPVQGERSTTACISLQPTETCVYSGKL
jgi:hypothetical protein